MGRSPFPRSSTLTNGLGPAVDYPSRPVSRDHYFVQCRAGRLARRRCQAIDKAEQDIDLPDSFVTSFQGAAAAFRASTTNEALSDHRGGDHDVYRARCAL